MEGFQVLNISASARVSRSLQKLARGKLDAAAAGPSFCRYGRNRCPEGVLDEKSAPLPVVMVTGWRRSLIDLGAAPRHRDYIPKSQLLDVLPAVLKSVDHGIPQVEGAGGFGRIAERHVCLSSTMGPDIDLTRRHFARRARHLVLEVVNSQLGHLPVSRMAAIRPDPCPMLRMPDLNPLDLLKGIQHRVLAIPVIVITGHSDEAAALA